MFFTFLKGRFLSYSICLGVHISKVKSVNLDSWTAEQIESVLRMGNKKAREIYEAQLPPGHRRPQEDYALEQFIRNKYDKKMYADSQRLRETNFEKVRVKTPRQFEFKYKPCILVNLFFS